MSNWTCLSCSQLAVRRVVNLGDIPHSDDFPPLDDPSPDDAWPLGLGLCTACSLVQLEPNPAPVPESPRAVESATIVNHGIAMGSAVVDEESLPPGSTFIEIDSHHGGSWRSGLVRAGLTERSADEQADLVVDVHALAHESRLEPMLAAHARRMAPGAALVLEFHHLLALVQGAQIDTVRHGHWSYLTLLALEPALARHGLRATRAVRNEAYGGSARLTARRTQETPAIDVSVPLMRSLEREAGLDEPETFRRLERRGRASARALHQRLTRARDEGRTVAGYGAPSKAAVLLPLADVDVALLPFTVDLSEAKHGRRIPGTGIPIRPVDDLTISRPDEVVILTWDISNEVTRQLRRMSSDWDPEIYVPLPEPRVMRLQGTT